MANARLLAVCLGLAIPFTASAQDAFVPFPPIHVRGVVQRPGVVYVLGRTRASEPRADPAQPFVAEILRSVRERPF